MKNLNKKIGVVVLSGLAILGGGLASSASASGYQLNRASQIYKDNEGYYYLNGRQYQLYPLRSSEYESKWKGLAKREVSEDELNELIRYGEGGYGYKILAMSQDNNKDIPVIQYSPYDKEVVKLFNSVQDFHKHVWKIGMPAGVWAVNIGGAKYIIQFNK